MVTASGSLFFICAVPNAMHGAVLRLEGSTIIFSGLKPVREAEISLRPCSFVIINIFSSITVPLIRCTVLAIMVPSSNRSTNCFGIFFLETGHNCLPIPPAIISA